MNTINLQIQKINLQFWNANRLDSAYLQIRSSIAGTDLNILNQPRDLFFYNNCPLLVHGYNLNNI